MLFLWPWYFYVLSIPVGILTRRVSLHAKESFLVGMLLLLLQEWMVTILTAKRADYISE
jgi:hypothetical protein